MANRLSPLEERLITAYFQGGNARETNSVTLKPILEVIKEAAVEGRVEPQKLSTFKPKPESYT